MRYSLVISLTLSLVILVSLVSISTATSVSEEVLNSTIGSVTGTAQGTIYGSGVGSYASSGLYTHITSIQNYKHVTLIQGNVNSGWSMAGTHQGTFQARIGSTSGTVIGSGEWAVFQATSSSITIHLQFTDWDIGSTTGDQWIYLTEGTGTTLIDPFQNSYGRPNYAPSSANLAWANNYGGLYQAGNYDAPTMYYSSIFSIQLDFEDHGTYGYFSADRTNTTYPTEARVVLTSNGVEVMNETALSGTSACYVMPDTVNVATIIFAGAGGTHTRTYYVGSGPAVGETEQISVNLLEKYSNAALINQAVTVTEVGGSGETKTSRYGETLHFDVVPGSSYWFNASRTGYLDYNETYTIPASPGIYNVYMERILTPIANHSYAHFSVVDQTNGGLIPNAEIRLSDGQTKLTNSAGYAWFSVNNSEQINYYVSKPSGYWPAYGAMNLTADESILVALQRYTGPTATATMPGWTPITVPTTGTGSGPVVTLSAQLREQNVQEGMDVWYTNLPFISQFLFLLFIIGGLGLMAGGTRRN